MVCDQTLEVVLGKFSTPSKIFSHFNPQWVSALVLGAGGGGWSKIEKLGLLHLIRQAALGKQSMWWQL